MTKYFDINAAAFMFKCNMKSDYTKTLRYKKAQGKAIDLTMSCNKQECKEWLKCFLSKCFEANDALAYLAVYDLYSAM